MVNSYPITKKQRAVLAGFTCERLTANEHNQRLTWSFFCRRNVGLSRKLQDDAWYEDREGQPVVYYIVKDPKGQIALYFSLKCGVLFNPDYVREVMDRYDRSKELMAALREEESVEWARDYVESLRSGSGTVPILDKMELQAHFADAKAEKRDILGDKKSEPNRRMIRVDEAFPAIELVHFCVNDWARKDWQALGMGRSLGETMFWHFVVPKIAEINALIGCEYVYLFAADSSRDGTLINYYENALHFDRMKHIGAIKPLYDFYCVFMAKRLHRLSDYRKYFLDRDLCDSEDPLGLEDYRQDFFDNFNITGDLV